MLLQIHEIIIASGILLSIIWTFTLLKPVEQARNIGGTILDPKFKDTISWIIWSHTACYLRKNWTTCMMAIQFYILQQKKPLLSSKSAIEEKQKSQKENKNFQINFSRGICHIYCTHQWLPPKFQTTNNIGVICTIRLQWTWKIIFISKLCWHDEAKTFIINDDNCV